jgi:hypothetical protein
MHLQLVADVYDIHHVVFLELLVIGDRRFILTFDDQPPNIGFATKYGAVLFFNTVTSLYHICINYLGRLSTFR